MIIFNIFQYIFSKCLNSLYLYRIKLVCIPGLKKKKKKTWLDLRMTFLYRGSVIVEELKAAVLSKTKPNKPEKQAEGLELSPSRER